MLNGAVVKLNGEFVLATRYGWSPKCIGYDFEGKENSVQGIIKAARFWEIGYLHEQYRDVVTSLVPEARFTQEDTESRFYVRLVGSEDEFYSVVTPGETEEDIEYDLLPEGVVMNQNGVSLPLKEVFRKVYGIDPDYNVDYDLSSVKDFLQLLEIDDLGISRRLEIIKKYTGIISEFYEMTEADWNFFSVAIDGLIQTQRENTMLKDGVKAAKKTILDTVTDPNEILAATIDKLRGDMESIAGPTDESSLSSRESHMIESHKAIEKELEQAFKTRRNRGDNVRIAMAKKSHVTDQLDAGSVEVYSKLGLDEEFILFMSGEGVLGAVAPIEFLRRRYMK